MPIRGGPVAPQFVAAQAYSGLDMTWTVGRDTFDLLDADSGIVMSKGTIRGLHLPPVTHYTSDSPALPGSRYRGSTTGVRECFWPVFIWADTSPEIADRIGRFFDSIQDPDVSGIWGVTSPVSGETRTLELRYFDDGDPGYDHDPLYTGWAVYGVTFKAYRPFWAGPVIERTFKTADPVDFFASSGAVFNISPGGTTDSAFIPNPGDVPVSVEWTLTGAVDSAVLGAGGGSVEVPFSLDDGDSLTIVTDPDVMTAIDQDGTDRSGDVVWNPAPIPPGSEVELNLTLTSPDSQASVSASLTPLYRRAF